MNLVRWRDLLRNLPSEGQRELSSSMTQTDADMVSRACGVHDNAAFVAPIERLPVTYWYARVVEFVHVTLGGSCRDTPRASHRALALLAASTPRAREDTLT